MEIPGGGKAMSSIIQAVRDNVGKVMIGKEQVTDLLLTALIAGGHVLLEDVPGTGKTVLARTIAKSMNLAFSRIQFTPDLLPSDITGLNYFDQEKSRFVFRQGPVFANLLLADEINRATPRTQSALLECMGEGQVTVDGETRRLEKPFFVIATQNPVETLGCFPLPEAQMDRFLMKIHMGRLTAAEEKAMLDRFISDEPLEKIEPVASASDILSLQQACRNIFVHDELRNYIVALAQKTRDVHAYGNAGVSPRGTLALLRASQAYAMVKDRDYVVPEDIKEVAPAVLVHRCLMDDESEEARTERVASLLGNVPVPTENWGMR